MIRLKNWLAQGGYFLLLELALVAALAAALSHWTWLALAPRTLGTPSVADQGKPRAPAPAVKPHLFGAGQGGTAEVANSAKLRLVGVVAPTASDSGRAVFALESGKSRSARVGEAVVPGIVVQSVHPDHVVLAHNGGREQLKLDRRGRR